MARPSLDCSRTVAVSHLRMTVPLACGCAAVLFRGSRCKVCFALEHKKHWVYKILEEWTGKTLTGETPLKEVTPADKRNFTQFWELLQENPDDRKRLMKEFSESERLRLHEAVRILMCKHDQVVHIGVCREAYARRWSA